MTELAAPGEVSIAVPEASATLYDDFKVCLEEAIHRVATKGPDVERMQLLDLLNRAHRVTIARDLVTSIEDVFAHQPSTIEKNLDVIDLPALPSTWIEIDDYARRSKIDLQAAAPRPARVGYLISPHPSDPGVLVAAVARQIPELVGGACHLMPALCAVNLAELEHSAYAARRFYSTQPNESLARLGMSVFTYVPPGVVHEMQAFGKVVANFKLEESVMEARMEAAGEGVFMLGALLAINAGNVTFDEQPDHGALAILGAAPGPAFWDRLVAGFRPGRADGFRRSYRGRKPAVHLYPVGAAA